MSPISVTGKKDGAWILRAIVTAIGTSGIIYGGASLAPPRSLRPPDDAVTASQLNSALSKFDETLKTIGIAIGERKAETSALDARLRLTEADIAALKSSLPRIEQWLARIDARVDQAIHGPK